MPSLMKIPRRARGRSAGRPASVPGVPLRRVPAALLMLAAALALLLSGDGGVAQAQLAREVVLVSNTGQIPWNAAYEAGNASGLSATQGFHTGDNPGGYTLSTVGIGLLANQFSGEETLTLHIYSSNSDGTANALLYTLSPPATPGSAISAPGIVDFTAPVGSALDPDADYHVVVQGSGDDGDDASLGLTGSNEETGSPNWTIENFARHDGARNVARNSFRIHIKGTINSRVLVSNAGQTSATGSELGATNALARSVQALVGNLGRLEATANINLSADDAAQEFETGGNETGYTLSSIDLNLAVTSQLPTVKVFSGSATGTEVAALTAPSPEAGRRNHTYTAPTGITLAKETSYWVVAEGGDGFWYRARTTEDANPAAGWSIADNAQSRSKDSAGSFVSVGNPLSIRVNGTINPLPPVLVSNTGQTSASGSELGATNDLAQSFTTGDNPAGYSLAAIELPLVTSTGTDVPTVTLHSGSGTGTKVADFTGPTALTASVTKNYEYTPTTDVTLAASTEYWVVAKGGSAGVKWADTAADEEDADPAAGWSISNAGGSRTAASTGAFTALANALKLSVKGLIVNNPAAGAPSIAAPNVFRVPAALGVDFSNITDGNGVSGIAGTATYNWQRFAAGGTTLEADGIGTDATYTLTGADAGKTLKVVVSFTDDGGFNEGPLTSAATSTITAAATCNPPTYVGGATQVWTGKVGIGRQSAGSNAVNYGYYNRAYYNPGSSEIGSLVGPQLVIGSSRTIDSLQVAETNSVVSDLSIGLRGAATTALTDAQKRQRVLHVCGTPFGFAAATHTETALTQFYRWSTPGIDWSGHAERTVYISQDPAAPTAESATVNGTELVITFNEPLGAAASLASSAFSGKKTPDGGSETDLAFTSDAPSIVGNTLMLTLTSASSVVGTDENVKVTYTKPTGTANKLVDLFGNEAANFTLTNVDNRLADSTPPTLGTAASDAVLAADGVTLTLTFSEPLKEASVPASTAFTVKATPAGGSEAAAPLAGTDPVTVSGSTVKLKLAAPIAHNDTAVKVSYAKPTSGTVIEDVLGNDLATFPDRAVTNNSTVPRVSIVAVYPDVSSLIALPVVRVTRSNIGAAPLSVRLDITQDDDYASDADTGFSIPAGDTSVETEIPNLDYPGNMDGAMTFTVAASQNYAPALAPNNAATMEFKAPASGLPLSVRHDQPSWTVDEGGTVNPTVTFTWAPGLAAPRDQFTIHLTAEAEGADPGDDFVAFSGPEPKADALPGDWVTAPGGGMTQTVTISVETLQDTEVESNETIYLDFSMDNISLALDIPRTGADNRTTVSILDDDPLVVTGVAVASTPTGGYYSVGDTIQFTVTFNQYVTAQGGPQFEFELGGATRQAVGGDSEEEMGVTFEYTVASGDADDRDGISWGANALSLNGGSITLPGKGVLIPRDANRDHAAQAALPAHKVDTAKPSLASAEVDGTTLTLTFSEALNTTAPANTAFTVKLDGGAGANPTDVSIADRDVTLTLAAAVTPAQTATVTYAKPTSNPIKDLSGKEADAFTDEAVVNRLADSTPPTLSGAALDADGLTLTLTYNEALKTSSVPDKSVFTVERTPAGGSEETVNLAAANAVAVSGSVVTLKLATPIAHNDDPVKVSYAKPSSGSVIEDANGNDAASFMDQAVTNNSTVPQVSIVAVHADASPLFAHAEFTVTRSNTGTELDVAITITQTDTYLDSTTQTITIPAGDTEATASFPSDYAGNTSGDLTATVAPSPSYAPDNAATVRMKLPASGKTVIYSHQQDAYTVTEGVASVPLAFTLRTGEGVAQPRQTISLVYVLRADTALRITDYIGIARATNIETHNWAADGTAFAATAPDTIAIVDDSLHEGSEQFLLVGVRVDADGLVLDPAVFTATCPPGIVVGTDCQATVTIVDNDTLAVQSVAVTSTTGAFYRVGNTISFTVNFNGDVTVTGTPRFAFNLGGRIRQADYASGSDSTDLVFSYTVATGDEDHDGISWGANALGLNGGSIKFMHTDPAEQVDAVLDHAAQGALSAQKVDGTKPTLVEAVVDQTTLTLTFHEELNTTAPANTAFTVKVDGGSGTNPTDVSISGRVVTLTLGAAVTPDQTVTVSYTEPSNNPIKDLSGLRADSFTDEGVEPASDVVNFRAAPGNRRVTLSWDNPNDNTIVRYQYRYMSTSDSGWNPDWRDISGSGAGTTSYTATGLTNGIEYTFQARPVYNPNAPGKEGEVKSVPRGPLTAPRNLAAASAGDGELVLVWDDPNDITITGYQYRYRNTSDSGWNPDWTDIPGSGASTATHTLTGLTNNLRYTVEVRAVRDATEGPSARDMESPRGPLAAPASFAAASGEDRQVTLSWGSSGDDSITGYQYRYRVSSETGWDPDWTSIPGSRWTTTSYTVTGLANRTGYTFEVRALRGSRRGPEATAGATPEGPPTVPLAPGSLDADGNDKSITVWWQQPAGEDARAPVTSYSVRYRQVGTSTWRNVSRANDDLSGRQVISGLANRTHYEVQVAAVNRVGTGAWASARATPQGPTAPPPDPEGDETFDVGALSAYWNKLFHPDAHHNLLRIESCSGSLTFRVIWAGPAQNRRQADVWAAHVNTRGGAGGVSYSFSRSPGVHGGNYFEMNGTVRVEGTSSLTIQVRGRFGSNWGSWSPRSSLYCIETQ